MTENNNTEFFGDSDIKSLVEQEWNAVFTVSKKLIKDTKKFGFSQIGILPNPTVHQMLASLAVIDMMFEIILSQAEAGKIDADDTRLIFNARQQILNMEQIATALNNKDRVSYDEAVRRLKNQAEI